MIPLGFNIFCPIFPLGFHKNYQKKLEKSKKVVILRLEKSKNIVFLWLEKSIIL